jgi:predicted acyltransferase
MSISAKSPAILPSALPAPAGGTTTREWPRIGRPQPLPKHRLLSLDAFRGFVIASMLLVNNMIYNDATPRQLMHAPWGQGVTFTDFILPWFVFAMGVAVTLGSATAQATRTTGFYSALRVLRRVLVLVGLGVALSTIEAWQLTVGMGVLQLLGLSYVVVAALGWMPVWARLLAAGALMEGYGDLLVLVPVPSYGTGALLQHHNVILYLNGAYLARFGLAGVLSVVPAGALALLGTVAGSVLCSWRLRPTAKAAVLLAGGAAFMAGSLAWTRLLPLSKDLWTPSYLLLSTGTGWALLGFFYLVFDVARWRAAGAPFVVFGVNAIVAYVVPILFMAVFKHIYVPSTGGAVVSAQVALIHLLQHRLGTIGAMWAYTGGIILVWWVALLDLYRRGILIRV